MNPAYYESISVTWADISKVSSCILKQDVILQKKIDKKIRFKILKNIVRQ